MPPFTIEVHSLADDDADAPAAVEISRHFTCVPCATRRCNILNSELALHGRLQKAARIRREELQRFDYGALAAGSTRSTRFTCCVLVSKA